MESPSLSAGYQRELMGRLAADRLCRTIGKNHCNSKMAIETTVAEVKEILLQYPDVNFNAEWAHRGGTPLFRATNFAAPEVVEVLLDDPRIDPNIFCDGITAFGSLCNNLRSDHTFANMRTFRLFLKNPRVNLDRGRKDFYPPITNICAAGREDMMREWIASGRDFDVERAILAADSGAEGIHQIMHILWNRLRAIGNPESKEGESIIREFQYFKDLFLTKFHLFTLLEAYKADKEKVIEQTLYFQSLPQDITIDQLAALTLKE